MKCPNCSAQNRDDARFCTECGTRLEKDEAPAKAADKKDEPGKLGFGKLNKKPSKGLWAAVAIILVVALGVGAFFASQESAISSYTALLEEGNRYLSELDYAAARDSFLKAIDIDPKQKEAYLALSQIALQKNERKESQEWIEKMEEEIPESRVSTLKLSLEPYAYQGLSMDDSTTLFVLANYASSLNQDWVQINSSLTPFRDDGGQGLIDTRGKEYDAKGSVISGAGEYLLQEDQKVFTVRDGSLQEAQKPATPGYYYWQDGLKSEGSPQSVEGVMALSIGKDFQEFGLASQDKLVADGYEWIGSRSEGLFAACKEGKWGYIDESGKEVIPFEFEASWSLTTAEKENLKVDELCYGFSHGLVILKSQGEYGIVDKDGNIVVPFGRFGQILPVMDDGSFYALDEGIWKLYSLEMEPAAQSAQTQALAEDEDILYFDYTVIKEDLPDFETTPIYIAGGEYAFEEDGKFGAIDYQGKVIDKPEYSHLTITASNTQGIRACLAKSYSEKGVSIGESGSCEDSSSGGGAFNGAVVFESPDEAPIVIDGSMKEVSSTNELQKIYDQSGAIQVFKDNGKGMPDTSQYYIYSKDHETYYGPYVTSDAPAFTLISRPDSTKDRIYGLIMPDAIGLSRNVVGLFAAPESGGYRFINAQTGATSNGVYESANPVSLHAFEVSRDGLSGIVSDDLRLYWVRGADAVSAIYDNHAFARIDGSWKLIEFDEEISTENGGFDAMVIEETEEEAVEDEFEPIEDIVLDEEEPEEDQDLDFDGYWISMGPEIPGKSEDSTILSIEIYGDEVWILEEDGSGQPNEFSATLLEPHGGIAETTISFFQSNGAHRFDAVRIVKEFGETILEIYDPYTDEVYAQFYKD